MCAVVQIAPGPLVAFVVGGAVLSLLGLAWVAVAAGRDEQQPGA